MDDDAKGGSRIQQVLLGICGVFAVLIVVVWATQSLSGGETEALSNGVKELDDIARKRTFPNPATVKAWKEYRSDLDKSYEDLSGYLEGRDDRLDAFFPEFKAKSRNYERFKAIYVQKTRELYEQAKEVVVTDKGGMPLAMDAVFNFEKWDITPTAEEARPAQKKFWIHKEVVDVLVGLHRQAVKDKAAVLPKLVSSETGEIVEKGFYNLFPVTIKARMHHLDVPAFCAALLRSDGGQLLTRLRGLSVEKYEHLEEEYVHRVKEGEKEKVNTAAFVKGLMRPVTVQITFEVIDLN
jgi:hypothetical protein